MNPEQPRTVRLIEDRWATVRHAVEAIAIVAAGIWALLRVKALAPLLALPATLRRLTDSDAQDQEPESDHG